MIATWGGFIFNGRLASGTPISGEERTGSLERDVQDQAGGKPATLVKGPGLEQFGFTLQARRYLGIDPDTLLAGLRALRDAGKPHPFVMGGVQYGANRWLLTEIAESEVLRNGQGKLLAVNIQLTFEEFFKEGAAAQGVGSSAPGVSVAANDAYKVQTPSADEKADLKRSAGSR